MPIANHIGLGAPIIDHMVKVTAAGTHVAGPNAAGALINKTVGAATAVTMPPGPTSWQLYCVKDGKGDAATNNITITPAAGTVDGGANYVISENYGVAVFLYNGTEWNLVGTALSLSGTETSFIQGVTAGTAAANKALVLDANKAIATITTLTVTNATINNAALPTAIITTATVTNATVTNDTITNAGITNATITNGSLSGTLTTGNGAKVTGNTGVGGLTVMSAANQPLGFWGATPVVQPAGTGELVGIVGNAATNINATNMTSNGNTGSTNYSFNDVVKALKKAGLMTS